MTSYGVVPGRPLVATAADRNAVVPLLAMLRSLRTRSPNVDVRVPAVGLSAGDMERIEQEFETGSSWRVIPVDPCLFEAASINSRHLTRTAYAPLVLDEILPGHDRVIWLDADTIVLADLRSLWTIDIDGILVAACPDDFISDDELAATNKSAGSYFNSGVMLLNLALWRSSGFGPSARSRMHAGNLICEDQSVLNEVVQGRARIIDRHWNFHVMRFHEYDPRLRPSRPKIVHFCGQLKPWNAEVPFQRLFLDYLPADLHPIVHVAMPQPSLSRRIELARRRFFGLAIGRRKHWRALIEQIELADAVASVRLSPTEHTQGFRQGYLEFERPATMTFARYLFARICLTAARKNPFRRLSKGVFRLAAARPGSISEPPSLSLASAQMLGEMERTLSPNSQHHDRSSSTGR